MNAGYQTVKSRLLVVLISTLMIFGNVASPLAGAFNVYAAEEQPAATDELKTDGNDATITDEGEGTDLEVDEDQDSSDTDEAAVAEDLGDDEADEAAVAEDEDKDENEEADATEEISEEMSEDSSNDVVKEDGPNEAPKMMLRSAPAKSVDDSLGTSGWIYVDGQNGDDGNNGTSVSQAVKTWSKAVELLGSSDKGIMVAGKVSAKGTVSTQVTITLFQKFRKQAMDGLTTTRIRTTATAAEIAAMED